MRTPLVKLLSVAIVIVGVQSAAAQETGWVRHTIDDSSSGADGVRLDDVNGDGLPDIVTGWEQGGIVRLYLNPGPKKSRQPWPAVTVGPAKNTEDAVFVDLDGDGAIDVVSSCEGDTRTVHVHWAPKDKKRYLDPQAWTTKPIPATAGRERWMFALPMDIDQKHGVDLLVGSKSAGATVSWLEAPADPRDLSAWKLHKIVNAGWIMSMQRVDVNGDGTDDVLISDRSGPHQGVYWLQRIAPGSFKLHAVGGSKVTCKFLDTGDVDGDGRLDIVVATSQQGLTGFLGGAKWKPFIINGFYNKAAAVGDIDLDGQPDIVFSCNIGKDRSKIPLGWIRLDKRKLNAGGKRARRIASAEGTKYDRIELLDLDGDGDLDVLTCEENAGAKSRGLGVIWYENPTRGRRK